MNPPVPLTPAGPGRATPSFVLAAVITILFNTALAWAKDGFPALNNAMKRLTGHHWTTHGLADLVLFAGLGLIFMNTKITDGIPPDRLTWMLVGAVAAASCGLAFWYLIY
jgi:hypothetical protein